VIGVGEMHLACRCLRATLQFGLSSLGSRAAVTGSLAERDDAHQHGARTSRRPRESVTVRVPVDHRAARIGHPDAVALDSAVEVAAVLVFLEESPERVEEGHATLVKHALLDHLVCPPQHGRRDRQLQRLRRLEIFESAVEAAGLDDFRFHDTRHHFASWFMMRGGSLQALKELLGHSDIKTTLIYAHLSPAHLRSEVAKTERTVEPAAISAQGSAQEVAELEGVSPK
jgi:Phage integrase family